MTYTGNTTLSGGSLVYAGNVTIGAGAAITVGDNCGIQYNANITPSGTNFAPVLGSGATWTLNGATIVATSGTLLNVGSSSGAMTIGASGATINAGIPVTLSSNLLGSGNLTKLGNDTLTISNIGSSYTGSLIINAGTVQLGNNFLASVPMTASNSATIVATIDSSNVTWSGAFTGVTTNTFIKKGGNVLSYTASGKIDQFQGAIQVQAGALRLSNTGLHSSATVTVSPNAMLDVYRYSSGTTAPNLSTVTLASKGSLRVLLENPNNYTNLNQVKLGTLNISNGSVLVVQYDPSAGATSTPASTDAPVEINSLVRSGNDRLFVQFRPISRSAQTAGDMFPLMTVKSTSSETAATLAAKILLYPSIMYSDSYMVTPVGTSNGTTMYGNLFAFNGTGTGNAGYGTLYVKISSAGAWSGVVSGDPASNNVPSGAYLSTLMSQLNSDWMRPYTALDQYVTSMVMNGYSLADMSALRPDSAMLTMQSLDSIASLTNRVTRQGFEGVERLSKVGKMLKTTGNTEDLQGQLEAQRSLQSESALKSHGHWNGWTTSKAFSALTADGQFIQNVALNGRGVAYAISPDAILGYQMLSGDTQYQDVNNALHGTITTRQAQAMTALSLENSELTATVTGYQHDINHSRVISAVFYENELEQAWTAESAQAISGVQMEHKAFYNTLPGLGLGVIVKSDYAHHGAYTERGAEDMNLTVMAHNQAHVQFETAAKLGFQDVQRTGWVMGSIQVGYQFQPYHVADQHVVYGLTEYDARVAAPIQNISHSGLHFGCECAIGSFNGFALNASAQALAHDGAIDRQAQVSVAFEF